MFKELKSSPKLQRLMHPSQGMDPYTPKCLLQMGVQQPQKSCSKAFSNRDVPWPDEIIAGAHQIRSVRKMVGISEKHGCFHMKNAHSVASFSPWKSWVLTSIRFTTRKCQFSPRCLRGDHRGFNGTPSGCSPAITAAPRQRLLHLRVSPRRAHLARCLHSHG